MWSLQAPEERMNQVRSLELAPYWSTSVKYSIRKLARLGVLQYGVDCVILLQELLHRLRDVSAGIVKWVPNPTTCRFSKLAKVDQGWVRIPSHLLPPYWNTLRLDGAGLGSGPSITYWWCGQFRCCQCVSIWFIFYKEYHNETKIKNPKDYGGIVKWLRHQTFNL